MGLVIHDLVPAEWAKLSEDYEGWDVVSDNGTIHPCIGCFSCWNRDPGRCAVRDGYENMGYLIHHADEVVVISRYTYGGFSGFVKNVFDRCLGYVLPQFEVIGGETHHQKRYDEDKPFTFIFYGHELSDAEKQSARSYVEAVCANIRGHVRRLEFRETGVPEKDSVPEIVRGPESNTAPSSDDYTVEQRPHREGARPGRVILLNGSMRSVSGNSAKFARKLAKQLGRRPEILDLQKFISSGSRTGSENDPVPAIDEAEVLVLCLPLYVDGLPSQVIRMMERAENELTGQDSRQPALKKVYLLANMGLYESKQLANLFSAVRQWCAVMGYEYCGGLGISAGELVGTLIGAKPLKLWINKHIAGGLGRLAKAIDEGGTIDDIYAEPHRFPRSLYIWIANTNWNRTAKKNGIRPEDLYRQL